MAIDIERLSASVEVDPSSAVAELTGFDAFLNTLSRDRDSDLDLDTGNAFASAAAFESMMDVATRDRTVNVDVDRSGLSSAVSSVNTLGTGLNRLVGTAQTAAGAIGGGGGGLTSILRGAGSAGGFFLGTLTGLVQGFAPLLLLLPILLAGLSLLPGLFASIAAAAGVLTAAVAPLVGLLGLIVPAIGGLMAVLGVLAAGLIPVVQGVSAYKEASAGAGEQATALADKQYALAQANDAVADSMRSVILAEERLADARKALAAAPREAAEALEDQHFATRQAILSEKAAVLALEEAQKNLAAAQKASANAGMTLTKQTDEFTGKQYDVAYASDTAVRSMGDQKDARLAVAQAELDLAQARDNSTDQQRLLNAMEKQGIKNSDIMVDRRRAVRDAEWALADAHEAVAAAQHNSAQAQKALNEQITTGTAATSAWNDAMKGLTPTGVEFVKFIADEFMPAFGSISDAVQDNMLPGLERGLRSLMGMTDEIATEFGIIGKMIGDTADDFFAFWARPKRQDQLTEMFGELNEAIDAGLGLIRPFSRLITNVITAASPALTSVLDGLGDGMDRISRWMETDKGKKKTTQFFDDAAHFGGLWLDVLRPIGGILGAITKALKPTAIDWLESMAGALEDMSERMNTKEGQKTILDYVTRQIPTLKELWGVLGDISDILFGTSEGGEDSAFYKFLKALRDDLLPKIKTLMEDLEDSNMAEDFVETLGSLLGIMQEINWTKVEEGITKIADSMESLSNSIDGMTDDKGLSGIFKWLGRIATYDLTKIGDDLIALWDTKWMRDYRQTWKDAWSDMKRDLGDAYDWMSNRVSTAGDRWQRRLERFNNWFDTNFTNPIKEDFNELIDSLKEAWRDFTDWLEEITPDIPGFQLQEKGQSFWEDMSGFDNPFNQFGGPVEKGKPIIVGEKRPEVFVPTTGGRIMPRATPSTLGGSGDSLSASEIERIVKAAMEGSKQENNFENHFHERVDPQHVAREIAWSLS